MRKKERVAALTAAAAVTAVAAAAAAIPATKHHVRRCRRRAAPEHKDWGSQYVSEALSQAMQARNRAGSKGRARSRVVKVDAPEGWPNRESDPATSANGGGRTPVLGQRMCTDWS